MYNARNYLNEALTSVLRQSFRDFEVVVVDDGSTDGSGHIVTRLAARDCRLRMIGSGTRRGLARALNLGIADARGELIARMDADDIAWPQRFEKQVHYLEANPECVAVGCRMRLIDSAGWIICDETRATEHDDIVQVLLEGGGGIPHPSAMIRRDAMIRVGEYREQFEAAQDIDLWLRLAEIGRLANLDEILISYRLHHGAVSSQKRVIQRQWAKQAVKDACARQGIADISDSVSGRPVMNRPALHRDWSERARKGGRTATAMKHALLACGLEATSRDSWRCLARAIRMTQRQFKGALLRDA